MTTTTFPNSLTSLFIKQSRKRFGRSYRFRSAERLPLGGHIYAHIAGLPSIMKLSSEDIANSSPGDFVNERVEHHVGLMLNILRIRLKKGIITRRQKRLLKRFLRDPQIPLSLKHYNGNHPYDKHYTPIRLVD